MAITHKRKTNTDSPGALTHGELGFTQNKLFYGNQAGASVEVSAAGHDHSSAYIPIASATAYDSVANRFKEAISSHIVASCDSITTSGMYYVSPNDASRPTGVGSGTSNDYNVISIMYSDAWGTQYAGDFRTNRAWVRNKNNGTWSAWALTSQAGHTHTKSEVGLSLVDNTSDASKNVSGATVLHNGVQYDVGLAEPTAYGDVRLGGQTVVEVDFADFAEYAGVATEAPTTVVTNTGATLTLGASHQNRFLYNNYSGTTTITIPYSATYNFPIGTEIHILRYGAGEVAIAPAASVTLVSEGSKRRINIQYQAVTLKKLVGDTWILMGALKT